MARPEVAHTRRNLTGYYDTEKNSLDAVQIGTSGSFSAWAPMTAWEEYGFTSYNCCTNMMSVETMSYAVKEALKTQHPTVLMIDIFPCIVKHYIKTLDDNAQRYNTDNWKYSWDRYKLIFEGISDEADKLSFYFDIIKYHANSFNWGNYSGECHNIDKGYNFLEWLVAEPAQMTDEIIPLDNEGEEGMDNLIEACKGVDADINILFLYFPYGHVTDADIRNVNYIRQKVESEGFSFLNCELNREEFALDYNVDYWGGGHYNIYGAEKVTRVVGKYLKETYHLPDHRGDTAYEQWNEDLNQWKVEVFAGKAAIDAKIQEVAAN